MPLAASLLVAPAAGRAATTTVRMGVQKYGTLVVLRHRGTLEAALAPLGARVTWTEFPAGPQMLEAMNLGDLDFATTGEAPPVFAQAAGAPLLYVGAEPACPTGEAILVPANSAVRDVTQLRGKRVALNKGSNVHYLLVQALHRAGMTPADIQPTYLTPADARAAFEQGAVDAWVIWDPFLAAAQAATGARVLTDATGLAPNRQFFLATQGFVAAHLDVLRAILAEIAATDVWAASRHAEVAHMLAPGMGLPEAVLGVALDRLGYGVGPITPQIAADQQKIADAFAALRLIPAPVTVRDIVWAPA
jgi:sulfonate transport system substrate-binding protein